MHDDYYAPEPGGEFLGTLRHRALLILAFGLVGALGGWFYAHAQPARYVSTASVLINPVQGNPYAPNAGNDDLTSLQTEAQIVRSDAVIRDVAAQDSTDLSADALASRVSVRVPPNTQLLDISFVAPTADTARNVAQTFATVYLDHRRERAEDLNAAQMRTVTARVDKVVAGLRQATEAAKSGAEAERAFQSELARALNSELINLRAQRLTIENNLAEPGRVIAPASTPVNDTTVSLILFTAGGAVGGLLLGLLVGSWLQRRVSVLRTPRDVRLAGLPVLSLVPVNRRGGSAATTPAVAEAVRRIRAAVLDGAESGASIAVAGCTPESVEPGIARALAGSLARAGARVVLVDADTRSPDGSRVSRPGLTEVLSGETTDPDELLLPTEADSMRMLPPGRTDPLASDLFVLQRLEECLRPLAEDSDFLVLRAPNLASSQGEAMARAADATIVVVTADRTRTAELTQFLEWAEISGTTLLGAVLVAPGFRLRSRTSSARPARAGLLERAAAVVTGRRRDRSAVDSEAS